MTKKEMFEYLENHIKFYEKEFKRYSAEYGEYDSLTIFAKTNLRTYQDILNDFKKGGK